MYGHLWSHAHRQCYETLSFALLYFLKYTEFEGKIVGDMEVSGMKRKEMNLIKTHYMCIYNPQTIKKL